MYTFLLVVLILDCIVLVAAILLQSGKGGGLAATFGGVSSSADAIFGTRQAGNLLTQASWWSGGLFIFISFVLSLMSARGRRPASVLEQGMTPAPASAPATPGTSGPAALPLQPAPQGGTAPAGQAQQPAGQAPATPKR